MYTGGKRMFKYRIVGPYTSKRDLEVKVNELINSGWILVGGLTVETYRDSNWGNEMITHFYQSLVGEERSNSK